jgi:hypothetical protein
MDTTEFKPHYITMSDHTPSDNRAIGDFDLPGPKAVPCLRIAGKWLRSAGFERGMRVRIRVSQGRLVIEPLSSS